MDSDQTTMCPGRAHIRWAARQAARASSRAADKNHRGRSNTKTGSESHAQSKHPRSGGGRTTHVSKKPISRLNQARLTHLQKIQAVWTLADGSALSRGTCIGDDKYHKARMTALPALPAVAPFAFIDSTTPLNVFQAAVPTPPSMMLTTSFFDELPALNSTNPLDTIQAAVPISPSMMPATSFFDGLPAFNSTTPWDTTPAAIPTPPLIMPTASFFDELPALNSTNPWDTIQAAVPTISVSDELPALNSTTSSDTPPAAIPTPPSMMLTDSFSDELPALNFTGDPSIFDTIWTFSPDDDTTTMSPPMDLAQSGVSNTPSMVDQLGSGFDNIDPILIDCDLAFESLNS